MKVNLNKLKKAPQRSNIAEAKPLRKLGRPKLLTKPKTKTTSTIIRTTNKNPKRGNIRNTKQKQKTTRTKTNANLESTDTAADKQINDTSKEGLRRSPRLQQRQPLIDN